MIRQDEPIWSDPGTCLFTRSGPINVCAVNCPSPCIVWETGLMGNELSCAIGITRSVTPSFSPGNR